MATSAEIIKELRNKSGAGFLDCKNALSENNNDIDKAIEYLRKKGLAKASKKTTRDAKEGAIGIYENENKLVVLKLNSETDFAAKSDSFLSFIDELGYFALENPDNNLNKDNFLNLKYNNSTISESLNSMIAKIGENLIINDLIIFNKNNSFFSFYIHNSYKENVGKIISVLDYNSDSNNDNIKALSKNLCMHIAAMKPESLDINDLDEEIINNETKIQKELILNSGKPSNVADKILEGKMKKFYSEITFFNQNFILDPDKTVRQFVDEKTRDINFKINSFKLITL